MLAITSPSLFKRLLFSEKSMKESTLETITTPTLLIGNTMALCLLKKSKVHSNNKMEKKFGTPKMLPQSTERNFTFPFLLKSTK